MSLLDAFLLDPLEGNTQAKFWALPHAELRRTSRPTTCGVRVGVVEANPPAIFPQVLLRRNVIRPADGIADPPSGYWRVGLSVFSGGGVIIEENVVDASYSDPVKLQASVQFGACNSTQLFANQTPAGGLVQGFNKAPTVNAYVNELSNVEDTILLAI